MQAPVKDRRAVIAAMAPALRPGLFIFCSTADRSRVVPCLSVAVAMIAEDEGPSFVLPIADARGLGFDCALPMRQITLTVHSALDGVGLTAAVAGILADQAIPCNMIAGFHHDHLFVPEALAGRAMEALTALQQDAG